LENIRPIVIAGLAKLVELVNPQPARLSDPFTGSKHDRRLSR
jgi:hypothetical protein